MFSRQVVFKNVFKDQQLFWELFLEPKKDFKSFSFLEFFFYFFLGQDFLTIFFGIFSRTNQVFARKDPAFLRTNSEDIFRISSRTKQGFLRKDPAFSKNKYSPYLFFFLVTLFLSSFWHSINFPVSSRKQNFIFFRKCRIISADEQFGCFIFRFLCGGQASSLWVLTKLLQNFVILSASCRFPSSLKQLKNFPKKMRIER